MIPRLNPTSKASLKQQCLLLANGDMEKAERLYTFMIKDMEDIPSIDPVPPTTMQQFKDGALNTMAWLKENKNDIIDWVGFIQGMVGKGGGGTMPNGPALPPINN